MDTDTSHITISDLHSVNRKEEALAILAQITRIEKKTFPAKEAFQFSDDLWKKKPNTRVIYATSKNAPPTAAPTAAGKDANTIVAYAVYVRQKSTALLHKVCVAEPYRGRGVGRLLMQYVRHRLEREGCQFIQLWVDRDRAPARALYARCGFEDREVVPDYYALGRTGVRMLLAIGLEGAS